jgi:dCTP deaminase
MILTGNAIQQQIDGGHIRITPFDPKQLNPNSYDVRLGRQVRVYGPKNFPGHGFASSTGVELDAKEENCTTVVDMGEDGLVLKPGIGYLMHTEETIWSDRYVPVIDGKSSIGRLFVWVHVTAGYGDIGFDGQYTLEVACLYPTVLYPGMRIAQVRFHETSGERTTYDGNYTGQTARGAVASASWRQFT